MNDRLGSPTSSLPDVEVVEKHEYKKDSNT